MEAELRSFGGNKPLGRGAHSDESCATTTWIMLKIFSRPIQPSLSVVDELLPFAIVQTLDLFMTLETRLLAVNRCGLMQGTDRCDDLNYIKQF